MHPALQAYIEATNRTLEAFRVLEKERAEAYAKFAKVKAEEELALKAYKEAFERGEI